MPDTDYQVKYWWEVDYREDRRRKWKSVGCFVSRKVAEDELSLLDFPHRRIVCSIAIIERKVEKEVSV